jgi:hypothetical protein
MSEAQNGPRRGRRRLRRIDRELRRSDPELATMLSIFSRLGARGAAVACGGRRTARAGRTPRTARARGGVWAGESLLP